MSVDTKEHLEGRIADSLACGKYLDAAGFITLLAQLIADEREAAQPEPAAEINDAAALRKLVRHCWVHSVYPDCGYDQMDSAMKRLYDAVRKREPDADDKPEPAAEAGVPDEELLPTWGAVWSAYANDGGDEGESIEAIIKPAYERARSAAFYRCRQLRHDVFSLRMQNSQLIGAAKIAESELASRVAEAVAEKDKEHEHHVNKLSRIADEFRGAIHMKNKQVRALEENLRDRNREIKDIKQQLAAAQAEVERLRKEADAATAVQNELDDEATLASIAQREELAKLRDEVERMTRENADLHSSCDRDKAVRSQLRGMMKAAGINCYFGQGGALAADGFPRDMADCLKDTIAELTKLRAENARLTRPVEDERSFFASDANNDVSEVVGVLRHRAERNAREAAEAERDELREFVKHKFVQKDGHFVIHGPGRTTRFPDFVMTDRQDVMTDAQLDEVLAAFRAEKAEVQA